MYAYKGHIFIHSFIISLLFYMYIEELVGSAEQPVPESNSVDETMFVYYPDRLPSRRQLYYQLCDIKDEKLQELIHSNDGREVECTVCIIALAESLGGGGIYIHSMNNITMYI